MADSQPKDECIEGDIEDVGFLSDQLTGQVTGVIPATDGEGVTLCYPGGKFITIKAAGDLLVFIEEGLPVC